MRLTRPSFRLRTLLAAVACVAIFCEIGLFLRQVMNPTIRHIKQLSTGRSSDERSAGALGLASNVPDIEKEEAYRALLGAINDSDPDVRASVAYALTCFRQHSDEVIPILVDLTKDKKACVRRSAIVGLGVLVDPGAPVAQAITPLLVAASDDSETSVRLESAKTLFTIGRRDLAIPILLRLAREHRGVDRMDALAFLLVEKPALSGTTIQIESEPILRDLLNDQDPFVGLWAASWLIAIDRTELAIPMLRKAARDERVPIRDEAMKLLGAMKYIRKHKH
jgi:HEAT repeat protein